jgi:outer membrane protein insertion porin family
MIKFLIFAATFFLVTVLYGVEIEKVVVEGNLRTEPSVVETPFSKKSSFSEKEIDDILKNIINLNIFEDISIYYDSGTKTLKIKVVEFPVISSVSFTGNKKIDDDDIKEIVTIRKGELLDESKIDRTVQRIMELYRDKGYLMAFVVYDLKRNDERREASLEFKITEGSKSRIKKVTVIGNENLSDSFIKGNLNTKEDTLFSFFGDGGYKKQELEEDVARIMYFYNDEGYVNVKANKPTLTISPDKKDIYVTFVVTEGLRYKIGDLELTGDALDSGEMPDFSFTQSRGDWYKHTHIIRDVERIKAIYGDEGYPFVNIYPDRVLNDEDQIVNMRFIVEKGNKCHIERIDIAGNDRSRDKVIRRELAVFEGDLYSYTGQKRSEARVRRTGFYENVNIEIEKGSRPDLVKLVVKVEERRSGTFNVGAGFSTFESFVFNARVDQNNFLGYGQNISLMGQASKLKREINLSFFEPYFFDHNLSFSASFFYRYLNYDSSVWEYYADYKQNSYGFSLTFGIPFWNYFRAYTGYRLRKVDISGATEHQMNRLYRDLFTSSLEFMLSFDNRDDRMFATKGVYMLGGVELAHRYFGSDEDILKFDFNFRFYQSLFWGIVFKTNVETAYTRHLQNESLPFSERFRLGGMFSIRGYPFFSIGPRHDDAGSKYNVPIDGKDPTSTTYPYVIGGNKKFVINNELEIPIVKAMRLNLVGFLDAGNAWAKDENMFYINETHKDEYDLPLGMFWSAGFGIRWVTPIAPLSFEWGFPLTPRPGDPKFQFEFNIKNSF